MNRTNHPPRRPPKILYQFHYGDAQVCELYALTLREAIGAFKQQHGNAAIHEVSLIGRHGQWVPVSPDALRGVA